MDTPTQFQQHHHSQIFLNPDNSPLAVFVEASIRNRPKIVRSLRNHGAEICLDPARASIILVDPSTEEARSFVTNWGNDLDIAILDYAWVKKCIDANRLLLAGDAWGGCNDLEGMREEDYYKDDVEEDFEEFGPEPGPSKPSKRKQWSPEPSTRTSNARRKSSAASIQSHATSSSLPAHLPTPPLSSSTDHTISHAYPANQLSYDSNMFQNTQNHAYNPGQVHGGLHFSQQQQQFSQYTASTPLVAPPQPPPQPPPPPAVITHQVPMSQSQPTSPTDFGSMMLSQFARDNPEQFVHFVQLAMQSMQQGASGQMPNMAPPPSQVSGAQAWNTMNQMGNGAAAPPPQGWPQAEAASGSYYSQQPPHSQLSQSFGNNAGRADNMYSSSQAQSYPHSQSRTPSTSSTPSLTPNAYGGDFGTSPSPKRRMDDSPLIATIQEESDTDRKRKRTRSAYRDSSSEALPASLTRKRTESPLSLSYKQRATNRRVSSGSLNVPSSSQTELLSSVFVGVNGSPMLFFVQVDIRSRMQIIQCVKKNGGRITAEMSDAKFIILSAKGASFNKLAKEVVALRRHALLPSFVQACVDAGRIANEGEYLVEEIRSPASTRRKPVFLKPKSGSPEKILPANTLLPRPGSRIPVPTPPPLQNLGKGRYTQEERDFMLQVVKWAYHQDITLPQAAIARHLHANIPSRSEASWRSMMQQCKEDMQKIREELVSEDVSVDDDEDKDTTPSIVPIEVKEELMDEAELEASQALAIEHDATENVQVKSHQDSPSPLPPNSPTVTSVNERMQPEDETLARINALIKLACKHVQNPGSELTMDLITVSCYMAIEQLPENDEDEGAFWDAASRLQPCRTAQSWQTFYELNKDEILNLLREILEEINQQENELE